MVTKDYPCCPYPICGKPAGKKAIHQANWFLIFVIFDKSATPMSVSANQSVPEEVIHSLGYQNTDDFLRIQARRALEQKISYYQSRIDFYEQKYGMGLDEFHRRVVDSSDPELSKFSVIEKENDDFAWDDAIDFVRIYTDNLRRIRP